MHILKFFVTVRQNNDWKIDFQEQSIIILIKRNIFLCAEN